MNVLNESLANLRANFYVAIIAQALWLSGLTLLFLVNWKVAVGAILILWAVALDKRET